MTKVYIVEIKRSPVGKTNGALAHLRPEQMMATLLKKVHGDLQLPVDEVIVGNAVGLGGNLSRLSVLEAGLPMQTIGTTIDFQCGAALKALEYGFFSIASGHKSVVYVGGVESTSQEPRVFLNHADPLYHGETPEARGQFSPLTLGDPDMLDGAENCYQLLKPPKETIEAIVLRSHERAVATRDNGVLSEVICPMLSLTGEEIIDDESIRPRMSKRLIDKAKPLVKEGGYTTVANSCLTHDGASLIALVSEEVVDKYKLMPLAEIVGCESAGLNPNYSPLGPLVATRKLLHKHNLSCKEIASVEVNEAFAVKTWAMETYFDFSEDQINPLGGALAYGHPYGATGGVLVAHLIVGMNQRQEQYGVATMGVAGGQGIAVLLRKV